MEQIPYSPLPRRDGRRSFAPSRPALPQRTGKGGPELRWHLLDLVRICRERLQLRDRDIAVLRGLLSLLPQDPQPDQRMVFASNRVLSARCDGIDERTLRRRLNHLRSVGLVSKRPSPNGKRYQIRNSEADVQLSYGISLTPLFDLHPHLEALAETCHQEAAEVKALRAVIRDRLFHSAGASAEALLETARLALRRKLGPDELRAIVASLPQREDSAPGHTPHDVTKPDIVSEKSSEMTARNGQNDRHIQRSGKDTFDSDSAQKPQDISIDECLEMAAAVKDYAPHPPRSWSDLIRLSDSLAPAIGLSHPVLGLAKERFGLQGCALVVLGLVQAFGRIRSPGAYLNAVLRKTESRISDPVRVFHSLVRPAPSARCIPG
ncbi:replication initiation protein RepC [Pseudomonas sp. GX19020]|uniref:plasmid replication protein RepC n=1 Tax=Pseudomonas sp. GX19020 TaxID=2942277 RepID=UPI0020190C92|nr:plasmid replication protein RepC [Pseudomonas sp. GX19020]MCL4069199.1 replication initiation protein RepC [Pseudomonas sp. GX19020]